MMKKIKRPEDSKLQIIIKCLMTAVFAWSGFFWSGITVLNFFLINQEHKNLATGFLASSLILLLCLVLCWLRLYIAQFIPCVVGLIAYLIPAREMIDHAAETGVLFKPTFEQRYLPIIAFALLGLVLFALRVMALVSEKMKRDDEYNNRPAESILEKRKDD